jgi:hypothetical protein
MEVIMTKKHVNENYLHDCGLQKNTVTAYVKSIVNMGFEPRECLDILTFYMFNAPILKSGKNGNLFGLKSLKDYGWSGNSDMSKLEGGLLKAANLGMFCFIKSNSISQTLNSMNLEDKVCIEHPRAVIMQNYNMTVQEDGSINVMQQETRMECLFRHIRNSLAHNHTYDFNNGNIMLEDCGDNGKISARIIIPKQALIDWMKIIKNKESNSKKDGQ